MTLFQVKYKMKKIRKKIQKNLIDKQRQVPKKMLKQIIPML